MWTPLDKKKEEKKKSLGPYRSAEVQKVNNFCIIQFSFGDDWQG